MAACIKPLEKAFKNTHATERIRTTNIHDMATTADAIGTGSLLSAESHATKIARSLIGFGRRRF
jgi:hypothetical protein